MKGYSDDQFIADWQSAIDHDFVRQIDKNQKELERRSRCFDEMLLALEIAFARVGLDDSWLNRELRSVYGEPEYSMSETWRVLRRAIAAANQGAPKRRCDWAFNDDGSYEGPHVKKGDR